MTHQQVINYIKSSGNTITFTIDPAQLMIPNYEEPQLVGTLKKRNGNIYAQSAISNGSLKKNHLSENDYFDGVRPKKIYITIVSIFLERFCKFVICSIVARCQRFRVFNPRGLGI